MTRMKKPQNVIYQAVGNEQKIRVRIEDEKYRKVQDKHYISDFDKAAKKLLKKAEK